MNDTGLCKVLCGEDKDRCQQRAAESRGTLEERVGGRLELLEE